MLARHRRKKGLTQRDLSGKLQYSSPQFVSNWERGVSYPPAAALRVIARELGFNVRLLMQALFDAKEGELREERSEALKSLRTA